MASDVRVVAALTPFTCEDALQHNTVVEQNRHLWFQLVKHVPHHVHAIRVRHGTFVHDGEGGDGDGDAKDVPPRAIGVGSRLGRRPSDILLW